MKTSFLVAFLLFVATFSVPTAWAQLPSPGSNTSRRPVPQTAPAQPAAPAAPARPSLFWCVFTIRNGTGGGAYTDYVNDNLIHADAASFQTVFDAWAAYIGATYSIPLSLGNTGQTSCSIVGTDPPTDPLPKFSQAEQQWKASGHTIVHVNWTYTPQPGQGSGTTHAAVAGNAPAGNAAAPASSVPAVVVAAPPPITTPAVPPRAPAAPAPPRAATPAPPVTAPPVKPVQAARYAVCFGIMGPPTPSLFFSDPFQVTAPRTKVWSDAFREMLQQKYQFVGTIACGIRGATLEAAKTFVQTEKSSSHGGRKIVDTGWKFEE